MIQDLFVLAVAIGAIALTEFLYAQGSGAPLLVRLAVKAQYPLWLLAALTRFHWIFIVLQGVYMLTEFAITWGILRLHMERETYLAAGRALCRELQAARAQARAIQAQANYLAHNGCPLGLSCKAMGLTHRGTCLNFDQCNAGRFACGRSPTTR